MANFVGGMDQDLVKMFEALQINTETLVADMVSAGAEVVETNVKAKMPRQLSKVLTNNVKLSKIYKTPSDDSTNRQVMISGYFVNSRGVVTPAPLVANLFEYGRSTSKYPKKPFFRACFNKAQIEEAMLKAQEESMKKQASKYAANWGKLFR